MQDGRNVELYKSVIYAESVNNCLLDRSSYIRGREKEILLMTTFSSLWLGICSCQSSPGINLIKNQQPLLIAQISIITSTYCSVSQKCFLMIIENLIKQCCSNTKQKLFSSDRSRKRFFEKKIDEYIFSWYNMLLTCKGNNKYGKKVGIV